MEGLTEKRSFFSFLSFLFFFFFKILFVLQRESIGRGNRRGRSSPRPPSPTLSREPDTGLHPKTLGSSPELKADALPTEPPRRPRREHLNAWRRVSDSGMRRTCLVRGQQESQCGWNGVGSGTGAGAEVSGARGPPDLGRTL